MLGLGQSLRFEKVSLANSRTQSVRSLLNCFRVQVGVCLADLCVHATAIR